MAHVLILLLLSAWPVAQAHMQMIDPSPFRDPHADRKGEVPDYNILMPLAADGSNFACKGYHHTTPWTTVRTYNVGDTYTMKLKGTATHGGGSCQLSLSFDGGNEFRVIKSIIGGCPESMKYNFTIPEDLNKGLQRKTQGLFAWTWFNRIGNREMYMNCAVVDIVPKKSGKRSIGLESRDTLAAAQKALASYPSLFVANLKKINDCVTKETVDVIFDDPGNAVSFANGDSKSSKASFRRGECVGQGVASAGSSFSNLSPPSPSSGGSKPSGDDDDNKKNNGNKKDGKDDDSNGKTCDWSDGKWHPECAQGSRHSRLLAGSNMAAQKQVFDVQDSEDLTTGEEPTGDVAKQLDAYLVGLYGGQAKDKREAFLHARQEAAPPIKPTPFTWPTAPPRVMRPSTRDDVRPGPNRRPQPSPSRRPIPEPRPQPTPSHRPVPEPRPRPTPSRRPKPIPRPQPSPSRRPIPKQKPQPSPPRRPIQEPRPQPSPSRRPIQEPRPQPTPSRRPVPEPRPQPSPSRRPIPEQRPQPSLLRRAVPKPRPQPSSFRRPVPEQRPRPSSSRRPVPELRPQPTPSHRPVPEPRPQPSPSRRPIPDPRPQPTPSRRPVPEQRPQPSSSRRPVPEQRPRPSSSHRPAPEQRPQPSPSRQPVPEQRPQPSSSRRPVLEQRPQPSLLRRAVPEQKSQPSRPSRPNRRPKPSRRPRPRPSSSRKPLPRPPIRPLPIPVIRPTNGLARPLPRPAPTSSTSQPHKGAVKEDRPWQHSEKTTEEALKKELDDIRGHDGPRLNSGVGARGVESDLGAEKCQSPNRWYRRDLSSWSCGRKGRSVKRDTASELESKIAKKKPKAKAAPKRPRPTSRPYSKPPRKGGAMRWIEDQLARLEWTVERLTKMMNQNMPSARQNNRASKRQDTPSSDPTLTLFLQYLDRLQDKVIECIRLVSNGAGQKSPFDSVTDSSPSEADQKVTTNEKEKRQLVVPAMAGPLLQKFETAFDAVSTPNEDAKYEKRGEADATMQRRQMLTPGINGAKLPDGLVKVSQEIGDAAEPLPAKVKNPDGSTHGFPEEKDKDYSHAWANAPGKLGPKPSLVPDVAAELKEYLDSLETNAQKPTSILRANTTPSLRPTNPLPAEQTKSTPPSLLPKTDTWKDGVFPAFLPKPSGTAEPSTDDVAAVLPYFLGPGPVVPSGVDINWPGPVHGSPEPKSPQVDNLEDFPTVVNDLTPEDEEDVKKWFEDEAEKQKEALAAIDKTNGESGNAE